MDTPQPIPPDASSTLSVRSGSPATSAAPGGAPPHAAAHGEGAAPDTSRGHETGDLRLKGILIFTVSMVAATVMIQFAVYGLMQALAGSDARSDPTPSPLVTRGPDGAPLHPDPPPPLLQPFSAEHPNLPSQDLIAMRAQNARVLMTYGADPGDPVIGHIPIERAMDLIAQQGVPVASPTTSPTTAPVSMQAAPAAISSNEGGRQ